MKSNRLRSTIIAATVTVAVSVLALPVRAAEPVDRATMETHRLEALSKDAKTAAQHAAVARQYRLRAEALEAKAVQHEAGARKLKALPRPGMAYKWPAMTARPWEKDEKLARESRQAAQEAYAVADRHLRLSVEAQAAE